MILEKPSDLTPTLSMGLSIEHLVSMTTPIAAGMLWMAYGYEWVFCLAALVGVLSGVFASRIPRQPHASD